jgi:hypothetical protein
MIAECLRHEGTPANIHTAIHRGSADVTDTLTTQLPHFCAIRGQIELS